MKKFLALIILISGCSKEPDQPIERVIKHYDLKPLPVRKFESDPKYLLGQALFFDNVLSGNRDVSCATCHLWNRGSSDALPVSIGTHGFKLGEDRYIKDGFEIEHPRNSLDLWNRDNNSVKALFWDGRVEMMDPDRRTLELLWEIIYQVVLITLLQFKQFFRLQELMKCWEDMAMFLQTTFLIHMQIKKMNT